MDVKFLLLRCPRPCFGQILQMCSLASLRCISIKRRWRGHLEWNSRASPLPCNHHPTHRGHSSWRGLELTVICSQINGSSGLQLSLQRMHPGTASGNKPFQRGRVAKNLLPFCLQAEMEDDGTCLPHLGIW